jgi:hypothetical protein
MTKRKARIRFSCPEKPIDDIPELMSVRYRNGLLLEDYTCDMVRELIKAQRR